VVVHRFEVIHQPLPVHLAAITELVRAATDANGFRPLDDQHWLELTHGGAPGFAAVLAWNDDETTLTGYAQLSHGNASSGLQVVTDPKHPDVSALVTAALNVVAEGGGGLVNWWMFHATDASAAMAARDGFTPGRVLLQMRRPLPPPNRSSVTTRSFRVGLDEARWVAVNNRAFAGHLEQGGWTVDAVQLREAEAWFDADGFRLYEVDDRLAAFCWTKVHPASAETGDPSLGEIYVIAVDPDLHGTGLGRALTLAGLGWLHEARGIDVGMLYVDGANAAAMHLYERLGFTVHHLDRAYRGDVEPKTLRR
jgi:mycothiol synthase